MYTKTGVKLVENIEKMNEDGNIYSLGSKMSQNVPKCLRGSYSKHL